MHACSNVILRKKNGKICDVDHTFWDYGHAHEFDNRNR